MNWDAIGAIGQVLGSVAVLVTLVYLSIETKHAKNELRRSVSQSRSQTLESLMMTRATNERLAGFTQEAAVVLGSSPEKSVAVLMERGVSREAATALHWEQFSWWQYRVQVIVDVSKLSPGERTMFDRYARGAYRANPVGKLWYEVMRDSLNPEATHYIDRLLAQPG